MLFAVLQSTVHFCALTYSLCQRHCHFFLSFFLTMLLHFKNKSTFKYIYKEQTKQCVFLLQKSQAGACNYPL